jgi:cytoskeletal protein CcmA (bactofilin family)
MAKETESLRDQINIIGSGTTIKGDIDCNGDMRIDGKVTGNLKISGKIVIGPTGDINGQITCKNSEIEGKVDGKIFVAELLVLKSTAAILGDISTTKLAIEPGATFTGNCKMDGSKAPQANVEQK